MKVDYLRDGSDLLSELSAFATSASTDAGVMEVVSDIIASVKKNGDSALLEKTKIYEVRPEVYLDARFLVEAKKEKDWSMEPYPQVFEERHGFIPNLSILDLLFNEGTNALDYLKDFPLDLQHA